MKYLYILLFAILFACNSNEETTFAVDFSELQVSFESYPGGAIMYYTLPADPDIYAIEARYKDFKGKEIIIKGTYTNNEIKLFGFNEESIDVPVEIRLIDHNNNSSDRIIKTFSTDRSASLEVFELVEVKENWNGFRVEYKGLGDYTDGLMNIYYVGISPTTNQIDTLIVGTYPLQRGRFVFDYTDLPNTETSSTVVVKTEDFRGNTVKSKVYNDIPIASAEIFNCSSVKLIGGTSRQDDAKKIGWEYLFDGDNRGSQSLLGGTAYKYYSFMSEEGSVYSDNNVWTFDLNESTNLAWIRIYSHLGARIPQGTAGSKLMTMKSDIEYDYPNSLQIYGTNNPDSPKDEWIELGSYSESQSLAKSSKWIYPALDRANDYTASQIDAFNAMEPNYLQINFDASQEQQFRYIKIRVNETFKWTLVNGNLAPITGRMVMEEIEIYQKKK